VGVLETEVLMNDQKNTQEQVIELEQAQQAVVTGDLTEEDARLIRSISHRVKVGLLQRLASRFGDSRHAKEARCQKRLAQQAALADQMHAFEDLAQMYLAGVAKGANLEVVLGVKSLNAARRLDFIAAGAADNTPETQALMTAGLDESRARILKSWQDTSDQYWADFFGWMVDGGGPRRLMLAELTPRVSEKEQVASETEFSRLLPSEEV
jgi:hypothetical protein